MTTTSADSTMRSRTAAFTACAILILASLFVHFWRLHSNPMWYTDETNYITLASQLGEFVPLTRAAHKALIFPFATDAVPHPPLYFFLSGVEMNVLGKSVLAGRVVSAVLAVISMGLLWAAMRRLFGRTAAFAAAGLFAFHYPSVFFLRWGMPYNLAMACSIAAFWALAVAQRSKKRVAWDLLAVLFAGLSSISAMFGLPVLVFVMSLTAWRLRRKPVLAISAMLLGFFPFALFLAVGLAVRGGAFWHDFLALGARASGAGNLVQSLRDFPMQIARLMTGSRLRVVYGEGVAFLPWDPIYPLGMIGLIWIAIRAHGRRWIVAYFAFSALPVLLKRAGDPEIKYDEVMFLFLIYAGAGAAVAALRRLILRRLPRWGRLSSLPVVAVSLAIAFLALIRIYQVSTKLPSRYETFGSVKSIADARQVTEWINARVKPDDLVIAPERIDFLLNGRVTSVYQAAAFTYGSTTWHTNIESWRWAFSADLRKARFVIVDDTDQALVIQPNNENMDKVYQELTSPRWQTVYQAGEYAILERKTEK